MCEARARIGSDAGAEHRWVGLLSRGSPTLVHASVVLDRALTGRARGREKWRCVMPGGSRPRCPGARVGLLQEGEEGLRGPDPVAHPQALEHLDGRRQVAARVVLTA